jgi:CheY-like chemotaxis protein
MISFVHTSYGYDGDCHKLVSYEKVGAKQLVDYQSLLESLNNNPETVCIIVPHRIPDWQFSWKNFTQHLRLSSFGEICRAHVIVTAPESEISQLNEELKKIVWSYGVSVNKVEDVPSSLENYQEPLSEIELKEILPYVGNHNPNSGRPHDGANEWGPYRLLKCLADVSKKKKKYVSIEKNLLQIPFWRKKIVAGQNSKISPKKMLSLADQILLNIEIIHHLKLRVCVIEDELDKGWRNAYQFLFNTERIDFYKNLEEFSFENLDTKYDIVLLDLRISESAAMNAGDMRDIDELSGMKALREIRKRGNLLPVIMATASNKSWSYETAIQNGANGFWEKERPDLDLSAEYNYSNSNNLLKSIVTVNSWYRRIEPVLLSLSQIEESIKFPVIQRQVMKKRDTVIGQLFMEQTRFLKEYYGYSGEQTAFLSIWSIANDTRDYFLVEKDGQYLLRNLDWDIPYCDIHKENGKTEYSLCSDVLDYFRRHLPDVWIKRKDNHLDENALIILILSLRSKSKEQSERFLGLFFRLKTLRNHLSWIHGHSQLSDDKNQEYEWKFEYIEQGCRLWHFVFVGASNTL